MAAKIKTNPNLVQPEKWYEIFETGEHADSSGEKTFWSEEDLNEIASKSNASKGDIPLVIGHPKENSPAWGWSRKNFKVDGGKLLAQFRDVMPPFAEAVNNKQYPKISVSIRGNKTLRHIGFLGGNPPAVPGLEEVQFISNKDDLVYECNFKEYEDGDDGMPVNAKTIEAKVEADPREKELQDLKSALAEFMEQAKVKDKEIADLKTKTITSEFAEKARQREEEVARLKAQLERVEKEKREAGYNSFCEGLKEYITPADKPFVMGMLEICHDTGKYEFSEGNKEDSIDKLKDFLKRNLKKQVDFSETATKDKVSSDVKKTTGKTTDYDRIESYSVNEEELALCKRAKEFQEKNNVSFEIAMDSIRGDN